MLLPGDSTSDAHWLSICFLDIDECDDESTNDCDTNADCTNIDGGSTCKCKTGWEGDGKTCSG